MKPRAYGSGPVTRDNVTDDQIRDLRTRIDADPSWGGGGRGRRRMLTACDKALESRIYRGALAAISEVLNEELAIAGEP